MDRQFLVSLLHHSSLLRGRGESQAEQDEQDDEDEKDEGTRGREGQEEEEGEGDGSSRSTESRVFLCHNYVMRAGLTLRHQRDF